MLYLTAFLSLYFSFSSTFDLSLLLSWFSIGFPSDHPQYSFDSVGFSSVPFSSLSVPAWFFPGSPSVLPVLLHLPHKFLYFLSLLIGCVLILASQILPWFSHLLCFLLGSLPAVFLFSAFSFGLFYCFSNIPRLPGCAHRDPGFLDCLWIWPAVSSRFLVGTRLPIVLYFSFFLFFSLLSFPFLSIPFSYTVLLSSSRLLCLLAFRIPMSA